MIEVNLSFFLTVYLLLILAIFFFTWVHREGRKQFRSLDQQEGYLWQCPICAFIYLDPEEDKLSRCPRCQSFNKRPA